MKRIIIIGLFLISMLTLSRAGQAGCPSRMDRLDDFAHCMVPMRGTIGTSTVYTPGGYDAANAQLMTAMQNQATVPPQVMPMTPYPQFPMFGAFPWAMTSAVAYAKYGGSGGNPYFWFAFHPYYPIY